MFGDELTIRDRALQKRIGKISIYNSITINEKEYTFSRKELFEKRLSIFLPDQFTQMSDEHAKFKYPSEFRPELILSDDSGSVNITFSLILDEVSQTIENLIDSMHIASKRLNPSGVFFEKKVKQNENAMVGYYDYRGSTFEADIYILKFATFMNDVIVLGGFSSIWGNHDVWSQLIKQMISTICIHTNMQ